MNDLNRLHYTILSDPADAAAVRTALSIASLGVTAGLGVQVDQAVTATTRSATTTLATSLNHTLSDTSTTITAFNGVAGVTYSCRALGAGSITHHATNLIITQGGADLTTAAGMTFDVEMITSTTSRIKNVMKADGTAVVGNTLSYVRLNTANGYGSTNTTIRRFTNIVNNVGSDITYADSATLGATFTVNTSGVYSVSYGDQFTGTAYLGISINSTTLTTTIQNLLITEILSLGITGGADFTSVVSATFYATAGAVIRAHTGGTAAGATTTGVQFMIARVA